MLRFVRPGLLNRTTLSIKRSYSEATDSRLKFTLATPQSIFLQDALVDSVTVPGLEGEFEINSNLFSVVTQLKPGLLSVRSGGTIQKYLVSAGFIFVHKGSLASCNPIECVEIENCDLENARGVLSDAQSKLGSCTTEATKAEQHVRIETANAIIAALERNKS